MGFIIRKDFYLQRYFLAAFILSCCFFAYPIEFPGDAQAGEELRQELLKRIDAFKSLQCTYTSKISVEHCWQMEEKIVYRYQGHSDWMQHTVTAYEAMEKKREKGDDEERWQSLTEAFVNGKSHLVKVCNGRKSAEINRPHRQYYIGFMEPRCLVSPRDFDHILPQEGPFFVLQREKNRMLVHWYTSEDSLYPIGGTRAFRSKQSDNDD